MVRGSVRCSAFLRSRRRIRTESLPAAVSVSGKRNFTARDKGAEIARWIRLAVRRDQAPARKPADSGLFAKSREISVRLGLRGGPGRTRTSNQAVMSRWL